MSAVYWLVTFQSFNQGVFTGARFLAAVYAVHLGESPLIVGLVVALFSVAPTFLTVPAGKLMDRIGTRAPLVFGQVLMCVSLAALSFRPGMPLLYAVACIIGAAYFAVYIGASSIANKLSGPEQRAANFSRMSVGISVGQGVAPMILGYSVDHLGYPAAFAIAAMFPLLSWATFGLGRLVHLGPSTQAAAQQAAQGGTLALLRDPALRPVFVISTLFILAWDIFLVMTPIYGSQLGLSASQIGVLMGSFAVASFAARFAAVLLSRRCTPWQILLGGLVVMASGIIVFGLVGVMPLLMSGAFLVGLGYGICGPMSNTTTYEVAPTGRASESMALRLSLGMAAQSMLPLIVGSIGSFIAAGPIFVASGVMLLGGAVMERRQWRSKNKGTQALTPLSKGADATKSRGGI